MLFERGRKRLDERAEERPSAVDLRRQTELDQVNAYLSDLNKFQHVRNKWTERISERREKERRRMMVFVEQDQRDHEAFRRLHGRRSTPMKDFEPGEAGASGAKAESPPPNSPAAVSSKGWLDKATYGFLSAFKKRDGR